MVVSCRCSTLAIGYFSYKDFLGYWATLAIVELDDVT